MPLLGCSLLDSIANLENNSRFYQEFARSILHVRAVTNLQTHVAPGKTTALLNSDEFYFVLTKTQGFRF